jgi:hypothetical protein
LRATWSHIGANQKYKAKISWANFLDRKITGILVMTCLDLTFAKGNLYYESFNGGFRLDVANKRNWEFIG